LFLNYLLFCVRKASNATHKFHLRAYHIKSIDSDIKKKNALKPSLALSVKYEKNGVIYITIFKNDKVFPTTLVSIELLPKQKCYVTQKL